MDYKFLEETDEQGNANGPSVLFYLGRQDHGAACLGQQGEVYSVLSFLDIQRSFSRRVNAFMGNDAVPEHSPVGGHQRNGAVERCVRTVSEQFGMLHDHIEAKIAATIDRRNPLLQWLFPGSANLIARCSDEGIKAITGEVVHCDSVAEK